MRDESSIQELNFWIWVRKPTFDFKNRVKFLISKIECWFRKHLLVKQNCTEKRFLITTLRPRTKLRFWKLENNLRIWKPNLRFKNLIFHSKNQFLSPMYYKLIWFWKPILDSKNRVLIMRLQTHFRLRRSL